MKLSTSIHCALPLLLLLGTTAFADNNRPLGDSKVLAPVPFPGYPEGIAVYEGVAYVSGPAAFGVPGNGVPSPIFGFDVKTGALVRTITVQNQVGLHALSCLTVDEAGNLYVVDESQGIVKINLASGQQSVYAAPFYLVFASASNPPAPVLINDLAFDKKGNLYVTDSFQATIWRVPPGGGAPQVWFQGAQIDGVFGPNGIRISPDGKLVYFTVTFGAAGIGTVYTLPTVDHPQASDLAVFHTYTPGAGPDGLAFGKSGNIYVALAGYSQISVLAPNGTETALYGGPAGALSWANPANIAFDGHGSLLVTNHASLTGLPDPSPLFAVFDVYVNDKAGKMFTEFEQ
jgi:sugar lactone lactonase YvrE